MTYIEPRYQLPRYAASLGTPMERLANAVSQGCKAWMEALMPVAIEFGEIILASGYAAFLALFACLSAL